MGMSMRWLVLVLVVLGVREVKADGIEVLFQPPRLPDQTTEKGKEDVPYIDVTVIGAPNAPMDKFVLVDKSSKTPIEIKASVKRDYKQGTETLAIAIVMNGWAGSARGRC
jgi:hypothetical protein